MSDPAKSLDPFPYRPNPRSRVLGSQQECGDEWSSSAKPNSTSREKPEESDAISVNELNCRQVECQG